MGCRCLLISNGGEDHEELVVNHTYKEEKGSYNILKKFDVIIIKWKTVCVFRGKFGFGAIGNFTMLVWREL